MIWTVDLDRHIDGFPDFMQVPEFVLYNNLANHFNVESSGSYKIEIALGFANGLMWLRLIMMLKLFRSVGPLIKMLQHIVIDAIPFCVLYVLQLFFFGSIAQMLFNRKFKDLVAGVFSIWNLSLGNFVMT